MVVSFLDIEKALIAAVRTVDSVTPTAYPNKELFDKPDGLWLQLHNMRAKSEPVTLGDQGEDEHLGILQIDINYPQDKGSKDVLEKADEFAAYFTAGTFTTYNAMTVRILSCSLSPGRYVGGYYRLSISVNYFVRSTRS